MRLGYFALHACLMNFLLLTPRLMGQADPSPELSAAEQTGTLAGRVIDIDFADGLRGVSVKIEGVESQPVFTDLEGRYRVADLPAGSHTVIFEKENFQTFRVSEVTIQEGEVFTLNVPIDGRLGRLRIGRIRNNRHRGHGAECRSVGRPAESGRGERFAGSRVHESGRSQ